MITEGNKAQGGLQRVTVGFGIMGGFRSFSVLAEIDLTSFNVYKIRLHSIPRRILYDYCDKEKSCGSIRYDLHPAISRIYVYKSDTYIE